MNRIFKSMKDATLPTSCAAGSLKSKSVLCRQRFSQVSTAHCFKATSLTALILAVDCLLVLTSIHVRVSLSARDRLPGAGVRSAAAEKQPLALTTGAEHSVAATKTTASTTRRPAQVVVKKAKNGALS